MKSYTIWLPYFKQGDDLAQCQDKTETNQEALRLHASWLTMAAKQLTDIADIIGDTEVEIDAGVHHIGFDGPQDLIDKLLEKDLLEVFDDEEDEDWECEECGCFHKEDCKEESEEN